MSAQRRTPTGLLATLLLLTALSPMALVQAQPTEASEYYYGVEYDWTSLDNDLQNVSGLDIQALFMEIMEDATDAGFNLDLGQLTTGSTNVYVHQTEDISPQTIQDADGADVEVWSRSSEVVLRHGLLSNFILLTDWSETTFGSDTTSFDIGVVAEAENVLTVDIMYTEYLNDAYELVGADIDVAMTTGHDMALAVDIALEGGGETLNVDFDTGINFEYSIDTDAVWRLGSASPIYIEAAANDYTAWECVDDEMDIGVYEEWGETYVYDACGMIDGAYTGSAEYEIYLTGLPTEEFGFDAGALDITISDAFQNAGDYNEAAEMDWIEFEMDQDNALEVDLGDGELIEVVPCSTCPPGNPVMFSMLGNVLAYASAAFGDAVAEDFEAQLDDSIGTMLEDWLGDDGGDDWDDEWDNSEYEWTCDNGEVIDIWSVNDGYEDCADGSDEMDFTIYAGSSYNDASEEVYSFWGEIDPELLDVDTASGQSGNVYFWCADYSQSIPFQWVNDGPADCDDGSDEDDGTDTMEYTCDAGETVMLAVVNDGTDDCADGSDEGSATYYIMGVWMWDDADGTSLMDVNDLMVCDDYMACDVYYDPHSGGNSFWFQLDDVPLQTPSGYGELESCVWADLYHMDETAVTSIEMCDSEWYGPSLDYASVYSDGYSLHMDASAYDYGGNEYTDVTLHGALVDEMNNVVWSTEVPFDGSSGATISEVADVSDYGEYCFTAALVRDGDTEPFASATDCDDVEEEIEPSDRLITIAEAFADSGLENVLTAFGENLEQTFNDVAENEAPEFPYVDGMWAPLWSSEHATIVGVGVYAWDENDNGYVIAGPETTGYSMDLPMVFASITYITGVSAQEAQSTMASFDSLEDIVDVETHDLGTLADALAAAGADTSGLDLPEGSSNTDGTGDDGTTSAEDIAEDSGLLPFMSPFALVAMIGLAAIAFQPRRETDE
jgi:hypothetical protein